MKNLKSLNSYNSGAYWKKRSDLLYYRYIDYILRTVGKDAQSLADVGTGGCKYLEWFDWIPDLVSIDIAKPYTSESIRGINGNILDMKFEEKYDICTCFQVLEHIPKAKKFARKLFDIGEMVIVSVPYEWPAGNVPGHVHDPVNEKKLKKWMGREPNYQILVEEPFRYGTGKRLIAIYDQDITRVFHTDLINDRLIR
jgi:hypothetical protein